MSRELNWRIVGDQIGHISSTQEIVEMYAEEYGYSKTPPQVLDEKDKTIPLEDWIDENNLRKLEKEFKCHIENADVDGAVRFCLMALRNHVRFSASVPTVTEIANALEEVRCHSELDWRNAHTALALEQATAIHLLMSRGKAK